MKKLALLVLSVMLVLLAVNAIAESVSVFVIYSDTVDDKGWCQSMHDGIANAIADGYDISYNYNESTAVPDAASVLEQVVGDYDIIIAHGAQFTSALTEVAAEYPEQIFACGTSTQILGDNIFTYMPMSEEPGYINGIVCGMMTKANKVGIVGSSDGGDSARYVRGFVQGVQSVNPDASIMLSWTNSFSDTVGAGDIGKTMVEAGCDMMVGPAQQAVGALRVVEAAEGVLWAAQTHTQMVDFPSVVVSAADYDYSAVVIGVINAIAEGKTGGECVMLNYNNGGFVYYLPETNDLLPADVAAAAEAAVEGLMAAPNTVAIDTVDLTNLMK